MKKKYYSDLERLRDQQDEEIDTSDIPELDASFFEKAVISLPKPKDTFASAPKWKKGGNKLSRKF